MFLGLKMVRVFRVLGYEGLLVWRVFLGELKSDPRLIEDIQKDVETISILCLRTGLLT